MRKSKYMKPQAHMNSDFCKIYLYGNVYSNAQRQRDVFINECSNVEQIEFLTHVFQCMYGYLCGEDVEYSFFDIVLSNTKILIDQIDEKYFEPINCQFQNILKFYKNVQNYKQEGKKVPHIIFLIGNPGSGKSHIARVLSSEDTNVRVIKKYSTRPKRKDELDGVPETEAGIEHDKISKMKYKFSFKMGEEQNLCGVDEEEIIMALKEGKNPIIATTSLDLYEQLVQDFPCQVHLVQISNLVFNNNDQENIFLEQGRSTDEIKNRLGLEVIQEIRKYDYNLRTLVNPISFLKRFSEEDQKSFIYTQLKYIFEQFGMSLEFDFKKSELLTDYDEVYITTALRNTNYLYPFLSGMYDEDLESYMAFNNQEEKTNKKI